MTVLVVRHNVYYMTKCTDVLNTIAYKVMNDLYFILFDKQIIIQILDSMLPRKNAIIFGKIIHLRNIFGENKS